MKQVSLILGAVLLLATVAFGQFTPSYTVANVTSYNVMATSQLSTLYNVSISSNPYQYPIYFITLNGTRYNMGYDYGVLLGKMVVQMYDEVLKKAFGNSIQSKLIIAALEEFLDEQWDQFLSRQVPQQYLDELNGIKAGGEAVNVKDVATIVNRITVLANLPSDLVDMQYVLENELENRNETLKTPAKIRELVRSTLMSKPSQAGKGMQCSMFSVWGSRTQKGQLFSARNLDYAPDMGINPYKLVTVWNPNDGAYSHASLGYIGLYGALAGMSSQGITVHEANLEENIETFIGFPWIIRLRYIMENAKTISQAWTLWEATNNTIGYNHMVGSGYDASQGASHPALALETMRGYTAFFLDNDPREAGATAIDPSTNETVVIGYPLNEALVRTNHGYDPTIRQHYMWATFHAGKWSVQRYMFAYDGFVYYQNSNIRMNFYNAINITSILGDKGSDPYVCQNSTTGTNILSVTFAPAEATIFSAWENGTGDSWRPGACNTYVAFDMTAFGWPILPSKPHN